MSVEIVIATPTGAPIARVHGEWRTHAERLAIATAVAVRVAQVLEGGPAPLHLCINGDRVPVWGDDDPAALAIRILRGDSTVGLEDRMLGGLAAMKASGGPNADPREAGIEYLGALVREYELSEAEVIDLTIGLAKIVAGRVRMS